ncbi:SusC/RagA family TonB-linked outer membrane protein [Salmonirosea aquatica]|uniref:SusC/RagA family TonB-linked outer membrane protein n=1 Tax=Salmonirosea aquatica TaxID=2654236 RepID=A0A7C9F7P6_9BACT|nr:SusC/RagA family TonB-linked outer membrane protein [Cytophagaceae bacterium SJW1-29]
MKKTTLLFLFCSLLSLSAVVAQEITVTGKVTAAEDNSVLPGVSVQVQGTQRGTQSDASGNYSISTSPNAVLIFSFVGLVPQEISVGNRSQIDVQLSADTRSLSEVVVTGYGTQSKRNLTGNIAKVSGAEIANTPVTTFEQALQGRAAGVQITSLNGKLGQGIQMRIRGSSSVTASNEPLYVLDGIPLTTKDQGTSSAPQNPLADINFNDIESIDILKDASAAAIYGARASNGVVLITTKKGKSGKTKFSVGYQMGSSKPTHLRDWLNTAQYVELFSEAVQNEIDAGNLPASYLTGSTYSRFDRYAAGDRAGWQTGKFDTDWQAEAFQKAPMGQFDISASGGDAKTRFFVSAQYLDQKGILIKNSFKRLSGRVNLDHKATDRLTLGVNVNLARTVNGRLSNDNAFSTPLQIIALPPITPVIDPRTNELSGNYTLYYNPLLNRDFSSNVSTSYRIIGNIFAEYKFTNWLKFRSELGTDIYNLNEDQYFGKETSRNTGAPNGQGFSSWAQITNYTTNNFFTLGETFADKHDVDLIVGMTFQKSEASYNSVTGQEFPSNAYRKVISAANITAGSSSGSNFSFLSYFGRANYRFLNKYLLSLSGRVDGSSRFGANNRYGFFPAASVGWVISDETFLQDIPSLSLLKLRASYGLTGNAEIGNFDSYGLYRGDAGYAGVPGQRPEQIENPDLRWEQTTQADIGLEFGFFAGRLSGEVDYYVKNTHDLLLNINVPGTSGFRSQLRNIGDLENKGWEFVLRSDNTTGAFKWSTSLNLAANRNKILNLDGQVIEGGYINRAVEGQPIGSFYSIEYAGVDPANGDALYYVNSERPDGSLDRNTTNNPNEAQRVVIGNPNPKLVGGISNNFSYKGLEFNILFQGQAGNDIYNGGGKFQSANGDFFDNQTVDQLDRWQKPGDITNVPQARLFGANGTAESSRYLQKGDYLRLKNATLSYTLPVSLTSRAKLDRVRLYVTGQNLLTFTKYTGWDPEVNADYLAGNIGLGNDFYSAPQAKTIIVGLNLGF